jgi:peroxiredoxin
MKHFKHLVALFSLLLAAEAAASPAEAQRIRKTWDTAMETWTLETRAAATPEARAKAATHRPDLAKYAREMWKEICDSLNEEWTLDPAAWFLRAAPSLLTPNPDGSATLTFANEIEAIRKAVESHHMKSPKLTPMCMAMVTSKDPRSLAVLEKIQETHPDKKIQGVAALATAMILKTYGDDKSIMTKRINALRIAIIQSADVDLGGTTVAKLAEDELYIINYLTKGRTAPDLTGVDSAGRPVKLSDYQGKVVLVLFWNSMMEEAENVVRMTTETARKFKDRPFIVIGVNNDTLDKLRKLEAADTVTFKSFSDPANQLAEKFRIGSWPLVYVLDAERRIHYSGSPGSFAELTAEALLSEQKPAAAPNSIK